MKRLIRKYSYLFKKKCVHIKNVLLKRLKFYLSGRSAFSYDMFEVNKISYPGHWDDHAKKSIIVEIGTGHGELLKFLSKKHPESNVIGFEITKTYTRKTFKKIKNAKNCKVFCGDGYELVLDLFPDRSISQIFILFPDPWHKKRHHKRRPITDDWLKRVSKKLTLGGSIFFATDWDDYFMFVKDQFHRVDHSKTRYKVETGIYDPKEQHLVSTHYYEKWKEQGRTFDYLKATKI